MGERAARTQNRALRKVEAPWKGTLGEQVYVRLAPSQEQAIAVVQQAFDTHRQDAIRLLLDWGFEYFVHVRGANAP